MGHLHNLQHNTAPSTLDTLGQKVRTGPGRQHSSLDNFGQKVRTVAGTIAGVVGTAKGIYDIGRTIHSIYEFGRAALPIIEAAI